MGNADIRDIAHIDEVEQSSIGGQTIAVDASNWLYKYMTTTARFTDTDSYTNEDGVELSNLIGVPRGTRKFFEYNVNPIFVFDGKPHELKAEEIARRKEKRSQAEKKAKESDDSVKKSTYQSRSQRLTNDVIQTTKDILDYLDISYITAPQAAESQAAYMTNHTDVDSVVSDDYDTLIFGSHQTIRQYTSGDDRVEMMPLDKTLDKHNITENQLILATILCGTDYNNGVSGVGPKTSIKLVKENTTLDELRAELDEPIENGEEIYELYKEPNVTDNWNVPNLPNPDTEAVREYLSGQGINVSEVDKALNNIDDFGTQRGLNSY